MLFKRPPPPPHAGGGGGGGAPPVRSAAHARAALGGGPQEPRRRRARVGRTGRPDGTLGAATKRAATPPNGRATTGEEAAPRRMHTNDAPRAKDRVPSPSGWLLVACGTRCARTSAECGLASSGRSTDRAPSDDHARPARCRRSRARLKARRAPKPGLSSKRPQLLGLFCLVSSTTPCPSRTNRPTPALRRRRRRRPPSTGGSRRR